MLHCKPVTIPPDLLTKLDGSCLKVHDLTFYHSLLGALQYLTFTRPNLTYVVQQLCLFMHDPREPHLTALKRVMCYVHDTTKYGLQLSSYSTTDFISY